MLLATLKVEKKLQKCIRMGITILKAIKNATGSSVIFSINTSFIYSDFVLTSVPNVGERFTKI